MEFHVFLTNLRQFHFGLFQGSEDPNKTLTMEIFFAPFTHVIAPKEQHGKFWRICVPKMLGEP